MVLSSVGTVLKQVIAKLVRRPVSKIKIATQEQCSCKVVNREKS